MTTTEPAGIASNTTAENPQDTASLSSDVSLPFPPHDALTKEEHPTTSSGVSGDDAARDGQAGDAARG